MLRHAGEGEGEGQFTRDDVTIEREMVKIAQVLLCFCAQRVSLKTGLTSKGNVDFNRTFSNQTFYFLPFPEKVLESRVFFEFQILYFLNVLDKNKLKKHVFEP